MREEDDMSSLPNSQRSGKWALVRYIGGIAGETPIDDCWEGEPVKLRMGVGNVPRGIDEALYEMAIGETRAVVIPPEKGYGEHDPSGVQIYQRSAFPNGEEIYEGFVGKWRNPVSQQFIPAICTKATKDYLEIDFNHPFAGKMLEYRIQLVDIVDE